jgi:ABC-type phosphate/phosphonate transport system substrate-binding protein
MIIIVIIIPVPETLEISYEPAEEYNESIDILIGVLAKRGYEQCIIQWGNTAECLNDEVEGWHFEILPLDFEEVNSAVENNEVDFVLVNPAMYVELEVEYGISPLVTLQNDILGESLVEFGGVIFTTADKGINELSDFQGYNFAAVDKESFGGWQVGWYELLKNDIDPKTSFQSISFEGTHDEVVNTVLTGEKDAGTVRSDSLERMAEEGLLDLSQLKILNEKDNLAYPFSLSTDLYPEWNFAKTAVISDELAHKVALALMEMEADEQEVVSAKINGWTVPQNYSSVVEVLTTLKVSPFEDYGESTVQEVIAQYRIPTIII